MLFNSQGCLAVEHDQVWKLSSSLQQQILESNRIQNENNNKQNQSFASKPVSAVDVQVDLRFEEFRNLQQDLTSTLHRCLKYPIKFVVFMKPYYNIIV